MTDIQKNPKKTWFLLPILVIALLGALYTFKGDLRRWQNETPQVRDLSFQPADVKEFMARAKAADAMVDPLARCLAFPEIPGSHWPENSVRSYCQYVFGPRITPAQIGAYLDQDDAAGLDVLFRKDLDRHFSKSDFSEVIHNDFETIGADDASDQLTARWLAASPNSAYAHMARGYYLKAMASEARGSDYANKTPQAKMQRMAQYAEQSIEELRRSMELEPRMMPAYAEMTSAAMMISRGDIERFAGSRGMTEDPGCMPLAFAMMRAMQPEWGGSVDQMREFSEQLAPNAEKRPLLRMVMERPNAAAGIALYNKEQYRESVWPLSQAAFESTDQGILQRLAYATSEANRAGLNLRWETIVLLLEATRFGQPTDEMTDDLADLLTYVAKEPDWAMSIIERRLAGEPDNAFLHLALGRYYRIAGRKAEAVEQYQLATRDPDYASDAKAQIYQMAHPIQPDQK